VMVMMRRTTGPKNAKASNILATTDRYFCMSNTPKEHE
jgi:hypothetical protein